MLMLSWPMNFELVSSPLPLSYSSAACRPSRPRHIRPSRIVELQFKALPEFLRSVDYAGLMSHITPFRINTSKKSRQFRITLILNDFKSTRINTSVIFRVNPSRINTSKKQGGVGAPNAFFPILSRKAFWQPPDFHHDARFPPAHSPLASPRRRMLLRRHRISCGLRLAPRRAGQRRFLETAPGMC
jgi:hypothetical protein